MKEWFRTFLKVGMIVNLAIVFFFGLAFVAEDHIRWLGTYLIIGIPAYTATMIAIFKHYP